MENKFILKFSNNIIEHLGVKLYQNKLTKVISEYISNGWDAGANEIGVVVDYENKIIVITDDGIGMTDDELRNKFLVIGRNRRKCNNHAKKKRLPMGRKGIGKLAGFGIAKQIDVISISESKKQVCWLRFDLDEIVHQEVERGDVEYKPTVLMDNGDIEELKIKLDTLSIVSKCNDNYYSHLIAKKSGTMILLSKLTICRMPNKDKLSSSLANCFATNLIYKDMTISLNGEKLLAKEKLPPLKNFMIGDIENLKRDVIKINGVDKEIKY